MNLKFTLTFHFVVFYFFYISFFLIGNLSQMSTKFIASDSKMGFYTGKSIVNKKELIFDVNKHKLI